MHTARICMFMYFCVVVFLLFMRNLHTCSCTEIPIFVSNLSVTQEIHRIPAVGCENLWHHAYNVQTSFTPTLKTTCLKNLPLIAVKNKVAKTRLDLGSPCNTDSVGTEPCCVLHAVSLCPVLHKTFLAMLQVYLLSMEINEKWICILCWN